jgi:hypothetical protein
LFRSGIPRRLISDRAKLVGAAIAGLLFTTAVAFVVNVYADDSWHLFWIYSVLYIIATPIAATYVPQCYRWDRDGLLGAFTLSGIALVAVILFYVVIRLCEFPVPQYIPIYIPIYTFSMAVTIMFYGLMWGHIFRGK